MTRLLAQRSRVEVAFRALERWGRVRGWSGTDPYDGSSATRLLTPVLRFPRGRQLVAQVVKRSPINLRPLLGIPQGRSAATLAHVVSAYVFASTISKKERQGHLDEALRMLWDMRSPKFDKPCWGYHWDAQTRWSFYPAGTPNVIATAFSGLALLDAYEYIGDELLLERASNVCDFILESIPRTREGEGAYFGYLPGDSTPIHNANMLACALCARAGKILGRSDLTHAASLGVSYTVSLQRPDGSWPYGERSNMQWIDGFHTGYVLDALRSCAQCGVGCDADAALSRGLEYYWNTLFLQDGSPKYYSTSTFPIDSQNVAQGLQTFSLAIADDTAEADRVLRILDFALEQMREVDGSFVFQRNRLWTNRVPHMRWVIAPMLRGLAHVLSAIDNGLANDRQS